MQDFINAEITMARSTEQTRRARLGKLEGRARRLRNAQWQNEEDWERAVAAMKDAGEWKGYCEEMDISAHGEYSDLLC